MVSTDTKEKAIDMNQKTARIVLASCVALALVWLLYEMPGILMAALLLVVTFSFFGVPYFFFSYVWNKAFPAKKIPEFPFGDRISSIWNKAFPAKKIPEFPFGDRISSKSVLGTSLTSEQKRRGVEIITGRFSDNKLGSAHWNPNYWSNYGIDFGIKGIVVYDTCFLMLNKIPSSLDFLREFFSLEFIVPTDVEKEIKKHMEGSDDSKNQKARVARKRIAKLIEKGAKTPSLPDPQDYNSPTSIGADSATDKRLIAYAEKLAKTDGGTAVFVATDDGGIMLDISHMRKSTKNIIAISKETEVSALFEFSLHLIFDTKDEKEVVSIFERLGISNQIWDN